MNKEATHAAELVYKLYRENKQLRKLVFARCPLHGKAFGDTENYEDMFVDGKCEGYCRSEYDDEPIDECKECMLETYYDESEDK